MLLQAQLSARVVAQNQTSFRGCKAQPALTCTFEKSATRVISGTVSLAPLFRRFRLDDTSSRCVVRIRATVSGLSFGPHGFHVHAFGDVRTANSSSTGGHFTSPDGVAVTHGLQYDAVRHWGDLGNLVANVDGVAVYDKVEKMLSLPSVLGRAIVIHAGKDQGSTAQPSGDAGSRQAHCVIGIANPEM